MRFGPIQGPALGPKRAMRYKAIGAVYFALYFVHREIGKWFFRDFSMEFEIIHGGQRENGWRALVIRSYMGTLTQLWNSDSCIEKDETAGTANGFPNLKIGNHKITPYAQYGNAQQHSTNIQERNQERGGKRLMSRRPSRIVYSQKREKRTVKGGNCHRNSRAHIQTHQHDTNEMGAFEKKECSTREGRGLEKGREGWK